MAGDEMFFFFNDTATTEIYTLSLHDALPISVAVDRLGRRLGVFEVPTTTRGHERLLRWAQGDRKSTRLNSSHANISYAVFCLKKKNVAPDPDLYRKSIRLNSSHANISYCVFF